MKHTRVLGFAALAATILLSPICNVEACGPFFEDDVFVSNTSPDDFAGFAKGRLGILQPGFDSNEYAVAWRYLNNGKLSPAELRAYLPTTGNPRTMYDEENPTPAQIAAQQAAEKQAEDNARPPTQWFVARAKYPPAIIHAATQPPSATVNGDNLVMGGNYINCPNAAFINATLTLSQRASLWGEQSPFLADWTRGQDAVFSNCAGGSPIMPPPAPAGSPALLKADRAYQIAAATFYAHRFDEAIALFSAIADDKSSPWNSWGRYLAARATVRLAFALGKATDPYSSDLASYDAATMKRAQQMLEALLAQPKPTPSRAIVQSELNFVLARTDPNRRAAEISAALASPAPDSNFNQDLKDLSWLLEKQSAIKSPAPLLAWISAWRGGGAASTFATWQQNHALPWLVVAIAKADPKTDAADIPALLAAAEAIPTSSPAYDTVFYHRVRLLIAINRSDEARALLDAVLPALLKQKPDSKLNALLGQRMAAARNFNEFLQFAPRAVLSTGSSGAMDVQTQCNDRTHFVVLPGATAPQCPEISQPWLDQDAAQIFNQQVPLTLMIEAANSSALPKNLRQALAIVAWTRSVLLEDSKSTAALAPLLPKPLRDIAGSSGGFPADLAILRNWGIRPYLEAGVPRVASYSQFDNFRDNWWCKAGNGNGDGLNQAKPAPLPVPAFIPPDQVAQASSEDQRLQQLPDSVTVIGQRVVDYAQAHPSDPLVPEALALTVRASHYACQAWNPAPTGNQSEYTPVSKAAFEFLHKHYPRSSWTLKTPYYY